MLSNYKIFISGIARPISFVSTRSMDGIANLAPFSYFQIVDHNPPIFVVRFSARAIRPKDTLRNLLEIGECVINIVSEHMIEAVNASSIDVLYGISEWALSGSHPVLSTTARPAGSKKQSFQSRKVAGSEKLGLHWPGKTGNPTGSLQY